MLANNNEAIINKLAKNSVKTNKKQYAILFFTIILSAFMLFCVFTIGMTYLNSSRLQNTRLNGAEYDIVSSDLQYFVSVCFRKDTILWIASISGYDKETACSFHN